MAVTPAVIDAESSRGPTTHMCIYLIFTNGIYLKSYSSWRWPKRKPRTEHWSTAPYHVLYVRFSYIKCNFCLIIAHCLSQQKKQHLYMDIKRCQRGVNQIGPRWKRYWEDSTITEKGEGKRCGRGPVERGTGRTVHLQRRGKARVAAGAPLKEVLGGQYTYREGGRQELRQGPRWKRYWEDSTLTEKGEGKSCGRGPVERGTRRTVHLQRRGKARVAAGCVLYMRNDGTFANKYIKRITLT